MLLSLRHDRPRYAASDRPKKIAPPHCLPLLGQDQPSYRLQITLEMGTAMYVRFGSLTDIVTSPHDVRFTPESRSPFRSITSSALRKASVPHFTHKSNYTPRTCRIMTARIREE